MTAAEPDAPRYTAVDDVDRFPARAYFVALLCPVLSMLPPFNRTHVRQSLPGPRPSAAQSSEYSVQLHVSPAMPATFLAQAVDDPIAPAENSLWMWSALRQAQVPAELHLFQTGGHGWGLGGAISPVHA